MQSTYKFLDHCGIFYLATARDNTPAVRPFGSIMHHESELYFSTSNTKDVYSQLTTNPSIEIVALDLSSMQWLRIKGQAVEITAQNIKQKLFDNRPDLKTIFDNAMDPAFSLFKISGMKSWLHQGYTVERLD